MTKGKMITYFVILAVLAVIAIYMWKNYIYPPPPPAPPDTAFVTGDMDVIKDYLKNHDVNADITYNDPDGKEIHVAGTPLAKAVLGGHPNVVKFLIEEKHATTNCKIGSKNLMDYVIEQKDKVKEKPEEVKKWDDIIEELGKGGGS
jgi:hypothetical protein